MTLCSPSALAQRIAAGGRSGAFLMVRSEVCAWNLSQAGKYNLLVFNSKHLSIPRTADG